MHQVVMIHGAMTFKTKEEFYQYLREKDYDPRAEKVSWKSWLKESLPENYEYFQPSMPNSKNADYEAWRIWFERLVPFLDCDEDEKLVLAGHSMGAIFLCKYLTENEFPKKISQLHLIAGAYDDSLPDEDLGNFSFDTQKLPYLEAENIFIYHSKDDEVVPFVHGEKLHEALGGTFISFEDRGHILVPEFPEILQNIIA